MIVGSPTPGTANWDSLRSGLLLGYEKIQEYLKFLEGYVPGRWICNWTCFAPVFQHGDPWAEDRAYKPKGRIFTALEVPSTPELERIRRAMLTKSRILEELGSAETGIKDALKGAKLLEAPPEKEA